MASSRADAGVPSPNLFGGIFLLAFATLLLEVSLTRVLSFTIWYHFAYVVISTALLGFGAAGTLVAVRPALGTRDVRSVLAGGALGAALASLGAILFFTAVPSDPMAILRRPRELGVFVAYDLVAMIPFFCSGLVVSVALREAPALVHRLYFWDLVGAGLGCAGAVLAMNLLTPPGAVVFAAAAFAAAAVALAEHRSLKATAVVASLLLTLASPFAGRLPLRAAASKTLWLQTALLGMVPRITHWSALFRTDVLEQVRPARAPDVKSGA